MTELSLAEALLLLSLDEAKGTEAGAYSIEPPLAGALLFDLVEGGWVQERSGSFVAVAGPPPATPVLAEALAAIRGSAHEHDAKHWVAELPAVVKPIKHRIADGLVARGVLEEHRHKVLGLFPTIRYPERDPGPERALRERVEAVLLEGEAPDRRLAMLIALMRPTRLMAVVVPKEQRKAAEARAAEVADSGVVGKAVGDALAAIEAAILAAVIASTVATTAVTISN